MTFGEASLDLYFPFSRRGFDTRGVHPGGGGGREGAGVQSPPPPPNENIRGETYRFSPQ